MYFTKTSCFKQTLESLVMDGEKLKLSKDGEDYLCPLCLKKGQKNAIMAYQLNLYEAVYNCSNLQCHFPTFSKKYYVPPFQRHYLNLYEPIKYPQVFYGPLPYFEGVMVEEDGICVDDEEEECIQDLMPEKNLSYEISSQEVDDLLDDILFDLKTSEKNSQQEGLEKIFAGVGIDDIIQPNHSEPNFNSSENLCDVGGEYENVGQKTFCSSESFHNASGMVHASGEAVSPVKQHINDREVPNSVGEVLVIPRDARVSFSTHDISKPCEISASGRSTFLKNYSYYPERNSDQRMDNAAPHLSETLPGSDHSYCRKLNSPPPKLNSPPPKLNSLPTKLNSLPTSFAPFEFTRNVIPKKRKPAGRKRKRRS